MILYFNNRRGETPQPEGSLVLVSRGEYSTYGPALLLNTVPEAQAWIEAEKIRIAAIPDGEYRSFEDATPRIDGFIFVGREE